MTSGKTDMFLSFHYFYCSNTCRLNNIICPIGPHHVIDDNDKSEKITIKLCGALKSRKILIWGPKT